MLQQFCAVSSGRKKARWRKSELKCHRRNNEASSEQLLRLQDHGQKPTHCNEVPHRQKTHATNNKQFKNLDHVNNSLYEVELAKAQMEHKQPIIVGFFILECAKLRTLELYYNFFTRLCDVNNFEELQIDTDSLYLALPEKEVEDCMRPEMRTEWQKSNDCVDSFTADAVAIFFPRTCCVKHKQHHNREPGLFKEGFRCTEMICLYSKTYCCYDVTSNKLTFSSKGLNKRVLEQSGDGPMEKYRRVLNETVNVTSNNRGFRKKTTILLLPMNKF